MNGTADASPAASSWFRRVFHSRVMKEKRNLKACNVRNYDGVGFSICLNLRYVQKRRITPPRQVEKGEDLPTESVQMLPYL